MDGLGLLCVNACSLVLIVTVTPYSSAHYPELVTKWTSTVSRISKK